MFSAKEVFPGIYHITDNMGVSFTLLAGTKQAILFDAGYGLENVQAFIRKLTDVPVNVVLSHAHHDHVLGARWFERVLLEESDAEEYVMRTGEEQRRKVAEQAKAKGVELPDGFFKATVPAPELIRFTGKSFGFECMETDLGGRTILCIHVPGHTPGSIMLYDPQEKLLLTGDNWNPCTWLWFPSSVPAQIWRKNMNAVCDHLPFDAVLCSHQPMLRDGDEVRAYLRSLTDRRLAESEPVLLNPNIKTRQAKPDGPAESVFVFDWDKWMGYPG